MTPAEKYPGRFERHVDYLDWLDGFAVMGHTGTDYAFDPAIESSVAIETFDAQPQEYFIEILRLARVGLTYEAAPPKGITSMTDDFAIAPVAASTLQEGDWFMFAGAFRKIISNGFDRGGGVTVEFEMRTGEFKEPQRRQTQVAATDIVLTLLPVELVTSEMVDWTPELDALTEAE